MCTYVQVNMSQSISDGTQIHTATVSIHLYMVFSYRQSRNVICSSHKCYKTSKKQIITTWQQPKAVKEQQVFCSQKVGTILGGAMAASYRQILFPSVFLLVVGQD